MSDRLQRLWAPHPRVRIWNEGDPDPDGSCVLYWMQRSQRGRDNAALNLAIALGNELRLPVVCVFGLTPSYPGAERRHYRFMLQGLTDAANELERRGVPFCLGIGSPDAVVLKAAKNLRPAAVIGDENPLKIGQKWRTAVAEGLKIPFRCVDGDVVVPSSLFAKEEFAARTLRPKIHRVLADFMKPIPNPPAQVPWPSDRDLPFPRQVDPDRLLEELKVGGVAEVRDYVGGAREAERRLKLFLDRRLPSYASERNEPTPYMTSELSAHLHFGHISPLTIALAVRDSGAPQESIDVYLEELIVRRELSVNFIARNPRYDSLDGCPAWALETLAKHANDARPHLYSKDRLEAAESADPLWNAAQTEMVFTGRMHNYLRMYWAKKILEWTPDAHTAFAIAIELNDRYEMDGRDPNGYTGIAWAIGGKHDRPWPERPIFGTVRFMSFASTSKKFDSKAFIARVAAIKRDHQG